MTLGDKLAKLRKENNYTQEQLAEILEVSRQTISKWESDTTYPETGKLIRLCQLFGCSTDYLLLDEIEKPCKEVQRLPASEKIFIESAVSQELVSCIKVKIIPVPNAKKGLPNFVLQGVDSVTVLGDHTAQLGFYENEDEARREMDRISAAIQNGDGTYTLQYSMNLSKKQREIMLGKAEATDFHIRLRRVLLGLGGMLLMILVLIFIGSIWDGWNDLWYQFGNHVYRWLH